jgi:hypothetical protein
VTGAAGSIVSAITADLAKGAGGGTFHLLDLTPTPDANDADLAAFRTDKDGLKATLAARMKAAGERPTPVVIDKELARIERLAAALTAIQAVEAVGGVVHYHSVDLTNAEAVAAVMADVAERSGKIDVTSFCQAEVAVTPQKEPANTTSSSTSRPPGSSTYGRAVCRSVQSSRSPRSPVVRQPGPDRLQRQRPAVQRSSHPSGTPGRRRGLALDWTAWGGIGMATRGSIPKIMEMAGVQMLPRTPVSWIRRGDEHGRSGEVVVAGVSG